MAGANRVHAHLAHDLELPLHRPREERRAERAVVVVQADALELHSPAVEMEAVVRRELERANAERVRLLVDHAAAHAHVRRGGVQLRALDVPQLRIGDLERLVEPVRLHRREFGTRLAGRHFLALGIADHDRHGHFRLRVELVFDRRPHPHVGRVLASLPAS